MAIEKNKSKRGTTWSVRWYDENKKERQKTFKYRWQADEHLARVKVGAPPLAPDTRGVSQEVLPPAPTFKEYADRWLDEYCRVFKSETSAYEDRILINKHLLPALGDKRLDGISKLDVKALQLKLTRELALKPKTVNNVTSLAHKMMDDAVSEFALLAATRSPATSGCERGSRRLGTGSPKTGSAFWLTAGCAKRAFTTCSTSRFTPAAGSVK